MQIVLYAEPFRLRWFTVHWFETTLPWIVAVGLTISLLIGVVTETARLIGGPLLASIVLGTYHRPVREQLIVMFLDLANSTPLAEKLGELRVHDLITRFFFDIDEPINDHGGSILSYVGDEVIVTWPATDDPALNARCLECFLAIAAKIAQLSSGYHEEFDTVPRFRAGLHCGPVIVSECGGVKRQLAYFGDTMNVSARLCEHCKVRNCNLIVSGDVLSRVTIPPNLKVGVGQTTALCGRDRPVGVHEAHQIRTTRSGRRLPSPSTLAQHDPPFGFGWAVALVARLPPKHHKMPAEQILWRGSFQWSIPLTAFRSSRKASVAPLSRAAVFLVLSIGSAPEAIQRVRGVIADIGGLVRTVGFRDLQGSPVL